MKKNSNTHKGQLENGDCISLQVEGGKISEITQIASDDSLPQLLPILFDMQHNGALGFDFSDMWQHGAEALHKIARLMRRHGVGRCLPTLITHPEEALRKSVSSFDCWLNADDDLALIYKGLFHEGVYISPQDGWRGVHDINHIRQPNWDKFSELDALSGNRIKVVNVAPEEPGGIDFIKRAADAGKLVAIGHACPDAATVHKAADCGASLVTHFGNGAAAQVPRFDNPFWAMLNEPRLRFGMIGDGFHLPPDLAGAALRCKGIDGCYFVSDAAHISGCQPGRYEEAYSMPCQIEKNGCLHVADQPMLAGAWFQLDRSVEWLVQTRNIPLREAWRLCSEVPAGIMGETLPSLEVGAEASFVLARWDEGLVIEQSVHNGTPYLSKPIRPTDCK